MLAKASRCANVVGSSPFLVHHVEKVEWGPISPGESGSAPLIRSNTGDDDVQEFLFLLLSERQHITTPLKAIVR